VCRPSSTGARVTRNQPGTTRKHRATVETDRTHTVGNFRTELMACVGLDRHGASARTRSSFFRGLAALTTMGKVGVGRVRDPYELARSRRSVKVESRPGPAQGPALSPGRDRPTPSAVRVEPGTRAKTLRRGGLSPFRGRIPAGSEHFVYGVVNEVAVLV